MRGSLLIGFDAVVRPALAVGSILRFLVHVARVPLEHQPRAETQVWGRPVRRIGGKEQVPEFSQAPGGRIVPNAQSSKTGYGFFFPPLRTLERSSCTFPPLTHGVLSTLLDLQHCESLLEKLTRGFQHWFVRVEVRKRVW